MVTLGRFVRNGIFQLARKVGATTRHWIKCAREMRFDNYADSHRFHSGAPCRSIGDLVDTVKESMTLSMRLHDGWFLSYFPISLSFCWLLLRQLSYKYIGHFRLVLFPASFLRHRPPPRAIVSRSPFGFSPAIVTYCVTKRFIVLSALYTIWSSDSGMQSALRVFCPGIMCSWSISKTCLCIEYSR